MLLVSRRRDARAEPSTGAATTARPTCSPSRSAKAPGGAPAGLLGDVVISRRHRATPGGRARPSPSARSSTDCWSTACSTCSATTTSARRRRPAGCSVANATWRGGSPADAGRSGGWAIWRWSGRTGRARPWWRWRSAAPAVRVARSRSLSGLCLAAAFPSLEIAPLAWIGLVPLLLAIRGRTPGAAFRLGWTTGFVFFLVTCYWIVYTIAQLHGRAAPVGPADPAAHVERGSGAITARSRPACDGSSVAACRRYGWLRRCGSRWSGCGAGSSSAFPGPRSATRSTGSRRWCRWPR